jgi:tetratricopeptide (TPR) repeat protein
LVGHSTGRLNKSGAHFLVPFLLFISILSLNLSVHRYRVSAAQVLAISKFSWQVRSEHVVLQDRTRASVTIDYPEDGSIFPPEITPPTFIWHDGDASVSTWRIDISFADGTKPLRLRSQGDPMQIGEIDPRCISSTNELPSLTAEQASAHTWKPDAETWALVKQHSLGYRAMVTIAGVDAADRAVSKGRVTISTSRDPVDGQIFYRDVPLMPAEGRKGIVQPLSPSMLYLIDWRIRDIAKPESRVVIHDMHTCANCHSFSADGKTMGMDVDGPGNDKGLYAIVPVQQHMSIRSKDIVSWNADLRVGQARVGFMSQVSPDGQYVLTTFAGQGQSIPSSYFVTNFKDYRFLQVFYPTRGILVWYSRATGRREPLPGADDPRYVQTDGVWSPDGKYVVFARAEAKDPYSEGQTLPLQANDPNEVQIKYSLYRVPFNGGRGGKAEAIVGASNNGMSNNFPKVSPDGRWIVFVQCRNGQLMRPDSKLYIVPATGGVARRMLCNTSLMNSWHSFSPNGRWLVFSSKSRSPYTQMFLTHIDAKGNDSPPIYIDNSTAANRAVNIPEFVNISPNGIDSIDVPASDLYRLIDEAMDLLGKGDNASALTKWEKALEVDPDDARANNGMGIALGLLGRSEEAIQYFQKAIQIDGSFFEAYYNLGVLLTRENRFNEAIDAWQNTVRLRPTFSEGHENLGYAFYLQAKFFDSLTQLHLALKEEPNRLFTLNLTAYLLATCPDSSIRNGAEAVTLANRANQLTGGKNPAILDTLSAAYAEEGRFAKAMEIEQQALELATQQGNATLTGKLKTHLARYSSNEPLRVRPDSASF